MVKTPDGKYRPFPGDTREVFSSRRKAIARMLDSCA
jgi:hypothetical protein